MTFIKRFYYSFPETIKKKQVGQREGKQAQ